jgi:hypothetical protein
VFRSLRVAALALVCLLGAAVANAEALEPAAGEGTPAPVQPPLRTPCPGTLELESRLRGLLEASACGVPERQLLVTLQSGGSVSGTLVVLHDYQAEYVREVSGPTCAEVESALTLALEIYLDPGEAGDTACAPKAGSPPTRATTSEWPGQDLDPFNLPEPEPALLPPVIEPQPSALVRAVAHIDTSYAPNVAFGVAAVVRLRLTPQNFVGLTLSHDTAPPFSASDGTIIHVSASALGLSLGQYLPIGTKGEFSLEAGPRVGVLETGTGTASAWTFAGTAGIALTVGLGARLAKGMWAGVHAGGVVNVVRARYLTESQVPAWEQPWTGGFVGLYFGAAVPGQPRRPSPPAAEALSQ